MRKPIIKAETALKRMQELNKRERENEKKAQSQMPKSERWGWDGTAAGSRDLRSLLSFSGIQLKNGQKRKADSQDPCLRSSCTVDPLCLVFQFFFCLIIYNSYSMREDA